MTGYINYSNEVMWKLWYHLEDAVREGTHRWQQAFGWDGPIFSHFFRTEQAKREFLHGHARLRRDQLAAGRAAFDLSKFRSTGRPGGRNGALGDRCLRAIPTMRAIVFDLADAVPLAKEIVGASPVADRVDVLPGDFFKDELPQGDIYALGRIVHDWTEEKILKLLGPHLRATSRRGRAADRRERCSPTTRADHAGPSCKA